jgi:hypothetical protein
LADTFGHKVSTMNRHISGERKTAYYVGSGLMLVGFLLLASVFVTLFLNFGDHSNFDADVRSTMLRAGGGIALLIVGRFVRATGARGLAGSGVVLDPEKARKDLEPYSRMAGGMIKDALEEANVAGARSEKVVMIKCRSCGKLNEEDSKFCQQCGKQI